MIGYDVAVTSHVINLGCDKNLFVVTWQDILTIPQAQNNQISYGVTYIIFQAFIKILL